MKMTLCSLRCTKAFLIQLRRWWRLDTASVFMRTIAFNLLFPVLAAACMHPAYATDGVPPAFRSGQVALYQPDDELRARIGDSAESLAAYIGALNVAAERVLAAGKPHAGSTGAIVVAVKPGRRSRVWLEFGNNPFPAAEKQALLSRLQSVPPLDVHGGALLFAITFEAWGGGVPITTSDQPVPIPAAWKEAAATSGGGALPEAVLDVLWPDEG